MNKFSKAIFYLLVGALLVLTSYRSYDFISRTMPPGQQLLSLAGLAAVGIGAVMWTFFFKNAAGWPKTVAAFLIGIDIMGEMALFIADVYLTTNTTMGTAALSPDAINFFLMAFAGIVAANIVAGILCEVLDPDHLEVAAERDEDIDRRESELKVRRIEHEAEIENRKAIAQAVKQRSLAYGKERLPKILAAWETGAGIRYSSFENTLKRGFRVGATDEPEPGIPSKNNTEIPLPQVTWAADTINVTTDVCVVCQKEKPVDKLKRIGNIGQICPDCLNDLLKTNPTQPAQPQARRRSPKQ